MTPDQNALINLAHIAADYLADTTYLALATVGADGNPWITPLYYSTTPTLDVLWASAADARHSYNIQANPRVAISCYDSSAKFGTAQGLYLEADAKALAQEELQAACQAFYKRRFNDEDTLRRKGRGPADFLPPSPRRMYRAEILQAWVLSPEGHSTYGPLVDERVSIPLELIRSFYRHPSPPPE